MATITTADFADGSFAARIPIPGGSIVAGTGPGGAVLTVQSDEVNYVVSASIIHPSGNDEVLSEDGIQEALFDIA